MLSISLTNEKNRWTYKCKQELQMLNTYKCKQMFQVLRTIHRDKCNICLHLLPVVLICSACVFQCAK